jgi:hypothetical protein
VDYLVAIKDRMDEYARVHRMETIDNTEMTPEETAQHIIDWFDIWSV